MNDEPHATGGARDPYVTAGLALLVASTLAVVLLYRSAPQSLAEATSQTWLATQPNAYEPHLQRARVLRRQAAAATDDRAAVQADSLAAEHAWRARELAEEPAPAAEATALWADALLDWAARLHRAGTGRGLRRDDNDLLNRALGLVDRVLGVQTPAPARDRAERMRAEIQRRLRPGPLEWLPSSR